MANSNPSSLLWLDNLASLEAQPQGKSLTQNELGKVLNLSPSTIGNLQAIQTSFDKAVLEKVRLAAQSTPPNILSLRNALAIAALKGKVEDLPGAVHTALDYTLSRHLATLQIEALVDWIISKKPLTEFDPKKVKKKRRGSRNSQEEVSDPSTGMADNTKLESEEEGKTKLESEEVRSEELESEKSSGKTTKKSEKSEFKSTSLFWEVIAGISPINQIKSRLKKGESLSTGEKLLVLGYRIGELLALLGKGIYEILKAIAKFVWDWFKRGAKRLSKILGKIFGKMVSKIFNVLLIVAILYGIYLAGMDIYQHGPQHPIEVVQSLVSKSERSLEKLKSIKLESSSPKTASGTQKVESGKVTPNNQNQQMNATTIPTTIGTQTPFTNANNASSSVVTSPIAKAFGDRPGDRLAQSNNIPPLAVVVPINTTIQPTPTTVTVTETKVNPRKKLKKQN